MTLDLHPPDGFVHQAHHHGRGAALNRGEQDQFADLGLSTGTEGLKVAVERRDAIGAVTTELVNPARPPNVHGLMTHRAGFTYYFFPKKPLRDRYRELGIDRIDRIDRMSADEMLQKLGHAPTRVPAGDVVTFPFPYDGASVFPRFTQLSCLYKIGVNA